MPLITGRYAVGECQSKQPQCLQQRHNKGTLTSPTTICCACYPWSAGKQTLHQPMDVRPILFTTVYLVARFAREAAGSKPGFFFFFHSSPFSFFFFSFVPDCVGISHSRGNLERGHLWSKSKGACPFEEVNGGQLFSRISTPAPAWACVVVDLDLYHCSFGISLPC